MSPRDPARIEGILKKIEIIWKKNPEFRFCQLIGNLFTQKDLYYIEDIKLEEHMDSLHYRDLQEAKNVPSAAGKPDMITLGESEKNE